jgi:hypothetical protein
MTPSLSPNPKNREPAMYVEAMLGVPLGGGVRWSSVFARKPSRTGEKNDCLPPPVARHHNPTCPVFADEGEGAPGFLSGRRRTQERIPVVHRIWVFTRSRIPRFHGNVTPRGRSRASTPQGRSVFNGVGVAVVLPPLNSLRFPGVAVQLPPQQAPHIEQLIGPAPHQHFLADSRAKC